MTLTFFKAAPPYNKTNGFWEQRMWTNGFTGPMTVKEAQRMAGMLGGRWFDVELPGIVTMTDLLNKLGVEMPKEFTEHQPPAQLHSESTAIVNPPDLAKHKEEERMQALADIVMNSKNAENKERVLKVMESVPTYAEQVKALNDAKDKKKFDYSSYIGKKRDVHSVFKAFTILTLKDTFEIASV